MMGVDVYWLDDLPDVLCYHFEGAWRVEDLIAAIDKGYEMSNNKEAFCIIYDLTDGPNFPRSIFSVNSYFQEHAQPQVDVRVIVGATGVMLTLLHIVKSMLPTIAPFHYVNTYEEAISYLRSQALPSADH